MKKALKAFKDENRIKEYRALPFWSWNDKLEKDELVRQIQWMKEAGFGGYFMHARGGLTTEYLGDDWFKCIEACLDAGKARGLQSWAYDENGWPSGFAGGKLLEDPENCDQYLTYTVGGYDGNALVSYRLSEEKLVRTNADEGGEYLNVYVHTSASTADILNPEVVDKFIRLTHEEYEKRLGKKGKECLVGFFTDEPQYYRWEQPYTKMIEKHFREVYGEDILDGLGLLFVEKEGYRDFRYKYWKGMQRLMLDGFAKRVYDWCEQSGKALTGHYVEETTLEMQMMCCAGIMPFYEYETIPGIDNLGNWISTPVMPKQVSSVAAQLGKKKVLTETFACCGWDVTPKQLKRIAEWQYVNGVNLMCQHLLPYSEHGQRKRDYPAHFSWANPWVREDFRTFNDYFARLGYLLGESVERVRVALFAPVRSAYFDYKRENFGKVSLPVDESYQALAAELSSKHIAYHIIDETVMEKHARVENGKLIVGEASYDFIVFPKTYTMDKTTDKLFEAFFAGGGKMLFTDGLPAYLEGEPHAYPYETNTDWKQIIAAQEYTVDDHKTGVQSTMRSFQGTPFLFAVNTDDEKDCTVTFEGKFHSFVALDLETLETKKVSTTLHFDPSESYLLFPSDEVVKAEEEKKIVTLGNAFTVTKASDNYMTLDKLQYSFDGVNYSEALRYMGVFNELLNARYEGEVYLKYSFKVKKAPKRIAFLAENMHGKECLVNGKAARFTGQSDFEKKIAKADISDLVREGVNEVVIKLDFYESEEVYFVLFGENLTEGLKNKLAYDTTIESAYLQGDFGVYAEGGFVKGKSKNVLLGNDFYLAERKREITDTVKDGYPFFAGTMTLETTIESIKKPCVLDLKGNYCLAALHINGKKVPKSYFSGKADISDYLAAGVNRVAVTLWSGNRNLLGPHHSLEENPMSVGPYTFELAGSWEHGKSRCERENYSFVRFGLFE